VADASFQVNLDELLKESTRSRSKVSNVYIAQAKDVFGEKAKRPEDRVVVIETEDGAQLTTSMPRGAEYNAGEWSIVNHAQFVRVLKNKRSNFAKFLKRYGHWPHAGLEVETDVDAEGFPRIVV